MKKGILITFEGGEGCGKSTQIHLFEDYLKKNKIDYILAREPGGTEVGEKIRNILLHDKSELSPVTELFLLSASRNKLVEDVILPALNAGKVVVLDRYIDSMFAYQGYAGNLKIKDIETVTKIAIGEHAMPDMTFLLDISYDEGMARKNKDDKLKQLDRMEQKGKEYHTRVRNGYLELAKNNPQRIVLINASQSQEKVFNEIIKNFEKLLKNI